MAVQRGDIAAAREQYAARESVRGIEGAVSDRVSEVSRLEVTKVPAHEVAAEFTPYQIPLMP